MFTKERTTRCGRLKMAFMAFALFRLSEGMSEVSVVPGGWLSRRCQTKLSFASRLPKTARIRRYCAPILPERFSQRGSATLVGGFSG